MANNYNYLFKYIIIGNTSVGKSNILIKFTRNKFDADFQPTIGVELGSKNIEIKKKVYRIQIWDTAGQEQFRSITRSYYNNSVCCVLVYDITQRNSFDDLIKWLDEINSNCPKSVIKILVGNKCDLINERKISFDEGKQFADENGLLFLEVSAKTGENINEIFYITADEIINNLQKGVYDLHSEYCGIQRSSFEKVTLEDGTKIRVTHTQSFYLKHMKKKKKKKCC